LVIDNYRLFKYLSDFAENWLKGVYMCQNGTCEIISQSDHSFNSYDKTWKLQSSEIMFFWQSFMMNHCIGAFGMAATTYAILVQILGSAKNLETLNLVNTSILGRMFKRTIETWQ